MLSTAAAWPTDAPVSPTPILSPPTPPCQSSERARAELRDLAESLLARGTAQLDALLAVGRREALLRAAGAELAPGTALAVVRAELEQPEWQPLVDWAQRVRAMPTDAADTIEIPRPTEASRRARALADWLNLYPHTPTAAEIVTAAETIATEKITIKETPCPLLLTAT